MADNPICGQTVCLAQIRYKLCRIANRLFMDGTVFFHAHFDPESRGIGIRLQKADIAAVLIMRMICDFMIGNNMLRLMAVDKIVSRRITLVGNAGAIEIIALIQSRSPGRRRPMHDDAFDCRKLQPGTGVLIDFTKLLITLTKLHHSFSNSILESLKGSFISLNLFL